MGAITNDDVMNGYQFGRQGAMIRQVKGLALQAILSLLIAIEARLQCPTYTSDGKRRKTRKTQCSEADCC
eukprot:3962390-Amphidinium_carterae.2